MDPRVAEWLEYYGGDVHGDLVYLPEGMEDVDGFVCYPLNDCCYEWLSEQVYYSPLLVGTVPRERRDETSSADVLEGEASE